MHSGIVEQLLSLGNVEVVYEFIGPFQLFFAYMLSPVIKLVQCIDVLITLHTYFKE